MTIVADLEETLTWLEKGRDEAASVALWAFQELQATPRRRWCRRRFLSETWEAKHRQATELAEDVKEARADLRRARAAGDPAP